MNVFVLCTGRCGSTTFAKAAGHATNFTAGHETRTMHLGSQRFAYPDRHVEVDNRLSWFLARLDAAFGRDAFYVHLERDVEATAASFLRRYDQGIIKAYRSTLLMGSKRGLGAEPIDFCRDYCETVNTNIRLFLKDKPLTMDFRMEQASQHWPEFWQKAGMIGDYPASLAEWAVTHNASTVGTED